MKKVFLRRVQGMSMAPALQPGAVIAVIKKTPLSGDIVVASLGGREVVKRLDHIVAGGYYLVGDNRLESTDSRELGPVAKDAIKGVVMFHFPRATQPRRSQSLQLVCYIVAAVWLAMAVMQLVRFDKLVPVLADSLSNSALPAAAFLVTAEVFALPFLLGMALSPLAKLMSLACSWFAALGCVLLGLVTLDADQSIHFGMLIDIPGGSWAVVFGLLLLLVNGYISWHSFGK